MARHSARVGATVPGAFTATWPLVGLRFDDRGFELAGSVLIGRLLASSFPRACPWGDVSSVRRITAGVEIALRDRRRIRLVTPRVGRLGLLADKARQNGVSIEG